MEALQINTGEVRIPIVRNGQSVGEIVFNPNETTIAERFYRLLGNLSEKKKQMETRAKEMESNTTYNADGVPTNLPEYLDFARNAHEALCVEYDSIFGAGTSQMVFGDFVPMNEAGFQVHLQFINGFAPHIQKARAEKIAQYTTPASAKRNKRK